MYFTLGELIQLGICLSAFGSFVVSLVNLILIITADSNSKNKRK